MSDERVHFGGPDRPIGYLRDLLAERIARVASGGSIDWVTYYFRDRRLAAALVDARRRGVDVRVTLEGRPRTPRANDAVIALLADALGPGLRVVRSRLDATPLGKLARPRLHEKLYCFSQPTPAAWVGSFNPSSDSPELDPALIEDLGDHDRAHNLLVELREPTLVAALVLHARRLHAERHGFLARFAPSANRALAARGCSVHFWPRVRRHPVLRVLRALDRGARVRIAASHISGPSSLRGLCALAARGVSLEILAESTLRRVPSAAERRLVRAGARVRHLRGGEWIPMHNKFALVEANGSRTAVFGSFNWSEPSYRFNREIGVISSEPALFDALAARWEEIVAGAD